VGITVEREGFGGGSVAVVEVTTPGFAETPA
jgi:hypothetical protein